MFTKTGKVLVDDREAANDASGATGSHGARHRLDS